eukprot:Anaeramoba_ignava/a360065_115.p1 GENE.a360065_115~~a360065_115.p1  ORF type:complete len:190 (-),score=53.56 a360065_115:192-761(-)
MGISRDSDHKKRLTGAKKSQWRKKRKHTMGRPAANTKLGEKRIRLVRVRGGNQKFRALRLNSGNFSWGTEAISRKTNILDVVYNASNNELVRTKTLVKSAIVQIDATPFKQWYEQHYGEKIRKDMNEKRRLKELKKTKLKEKLLNAKKEKKEEERNERLGKKKKKRKRGKRKRKKKGQKKGRKKKKRKS